MRNIFTFLVLLIISANLFAQNKQALLSILRSDNSFAGLQVKNLAEQQNNRVLPKKDNAKVSIRLRCSLSENRSEKLLVVDGIPYEMSYLEKMDINSIDSVFILSRNEALAIFGSQGTAGVILITTKEQAFKTLLIRDFLDGVVIPGATVTFISSDKRDTLMYVADSEGQVRTNELKRNKGWLVNVTSSGYRSFTGQLSYSKEQEILLERDFKTGPEAIIAVYDYGRRITCSFGYHVLDSLNKANKPEDTDELNIYPNPVNRGRQLNVSVSKGVFPDGYLKVLSFDGRLLLSVPISAGKNQVLITVNMDQRWAAGVYILQLAYANGRVGASEKVIIQ